MNKKKVDAVVGFPREVSGFSIINSLQRKGVRIGAYDSDPSSAGLFMKGLNFSKTVPDPLKDESAFIETLLSYGDKHNRPVLIDLESSTLEVIARNQDTIRKYYQLLLSPQDVLDIALDKAKTVQFFESNNLSAPKTLEVKNSNSLSNWGNCYPAVFKPRRGKGGRGQVIVKSKSEALEFWNNTQTKPDQYILQEWVPGPVTNLYTCGLLCAPGGEVRALFSGQRLGVVQTKKVPEGVTSYARSVRIQEILETVTTFAKKTGWSGMAEFEFKKDERDGKFKILEINPRFWAWVQLPVSCGINFPSLYYDIAKYGDCSPQLNFRENVYYFRSILHLYTQLYKLKQREIQFTQFIKEIINPYLTKLKKNDSVVLEDFKLKPEYYRWLLFYFRDTELR